MSHASLQEIINPTLFWENYTFRTMTLGVALIGGFSGAMGSFLYLRRQSMVADVVGHSAVTGIALSFIGCSLLGGVDGRSVIALTVGSIVVATAAIVLTNSITRCSRVDADTAMAVCLALFFGGGMVLLRAISHSDLPNRGGIEKYVFGNAATITTTDLWTITGCAMLTALALAVIWRPVKLILFDPVLARTGGFRPGVVEPALLALVATGLVVGIKAVGLLLMIGLAIMPATAARQWTSHLHTMIGTSVLLGSTCGALGSYLSVCLGKIPVAPIIIALLTICVLGSLMVAPGGSSLSGRAARRRAVQSLNDGAWEGAAI